MKIPMWKRRWVRRGSHDGTGACEGRHVGSNGVGRSRDRGAVGALVVLLGLLAGSARTAAAQDILEVEVVQPPAVNNRFVLDDSTFNQWVFGNQNRSSSAMDQLDLLLSLHLAQVEQVCALSEAQKRKLLLAGRGDIKRFNDRVVVARLVFDRYRRDQNKMNEIMQQTTPLAATLAAGLFNDGSVFAKATQATLTPEQLVLYRDARRAKTQAWYKAKVMLALVDLDTAVGMTSDQYHRLADLILTETKAPEKPAGQQDNMVMLLKIAKIPESQLRPIFDDAQWRSLDPTLRRARAMEGFLRAGGWLD